MKNPADTAAKNALLNILFFPGLGTLRSGRRLAGAAQIVIVLAGSVMLVIWLYNVLSQYYGQMFGDVQTTPVGWIGVTGGILFGISWLWASVTSLSLFREASRPGAVPPPVLPPPPPRTFPAANMKLDEADIQGALAGLPQWRRNGDIISRTFQFKDFVVAMKFVNTVAGAAESAQHHPDVDIRWNKVTLALTTHDAGGLTEKDFALARYCDGVASGILA